jgi:hypothetical protein
MVAEGLEVGGIVAEVSVVDGRVVWRERRNKCCVKKVHDRRRDVDPAVRRKAVPHWQAFEMSESVEMPPVAAAILEQAGCSVQHHSGP